MITLNFNGVRYVDFEEQSLIASGVPRDFIINAQKSTLNISIDTAAGHARAAFVSPGSYIDQEYLLAKQEAADWLEGEKDETAIPSSVGDHMTLFEVDASTAARAIVDTAEAWETALRDIRQIRLGGKAAVQRADTIEAAEAAAQHAIEQLNRYRPPEGAA